MPPTLLGFTQPGPGIFHPLSPAPYNKSFSPSFICGFECASIGTDWGVTNAVFDSVVDGFAGLRCARINVSGTSISSIATAAPDITPVVRFRFRLSALPTSTMVFAYLGTNIGAAPTLYIDNTGLIKYSWGGASGNSSAGAIVPGTWYTVQFWANGPGLTSGWTLDGTPMATPGLASVADTFTALNIGKLDSGVNQGTFSIYVDNVVTSNVLADFPISDGSVYLNGTREVWYNGEFAPSVVATAAPVFPFSSDVVAVEDIPLTSAPVFPFSTDIAATHAAGGGGVTFTSDPVFPFVLSSAATEDIPLTSAPVFPFSISVAAAEGYAFTSAPVFVMASAAAVVEDIPFTSAPVFPFSVTSALVEGLAFTAAPVFVMASAAAATEDIPLTATPVFPFSTAIAVTAGSLAVTFTSDPVFSFTVSSVGASDVPFGGDPFSTDPRQRFPWMYRGLGRR